ncbi:hypothetical protein CEXT_499801 [Caerostris extrusa]|uniref:Uncharacterized protein n=1 Tax=Caerostris extrusa TaxID=172846 RepID=A0AAV4MZ96_CAEEX|nr:hypothetical protein CEXT_499801 [Caerostris extrusa]
MERRELCRSPVIRSENETCATTLRRTHSWRSFHYLLGPVIERNKRRWARPDMIRKKIRARLRLGGVDAFQQPEERVQRLLTEISVRKIDDILLLCVSPTVSK